MDYFQQISHGEYWIASDSSSLSFVVVVFCFSKYALRAAAIRSATQGGVESVAHARSRYGAAVAALLAAAFAAAVTVVAMVSMASMNPSNPQKPLH